MWPIFNIPNCTLEKCVLSNANQITKIAEGHSIIASQQAGTVTDYKTSTPYGCQLVSWWLYFQPSSLLTPQVSSRRWPKFLGSCQPHGVPDESSGTWLAPVQLATIAPWVSSSLSIYVSIKWINKCLNSWHSQSYNPLSCSWLWIILLGIIISILLEMSTLLFLLLPSNNTIYTTVSLYILKLRNTLCGHHL